VFVFLSLADLVSYDLQADLSLQPPSMTTSIRLRPSGELAVSPS